MVETPFYGNLGGFKNRTLPRLEAYTEGRVYTVDIYAKEYGNKQTLNFCKGLNHLSFDLQLGTVPVGRAVVCCSAVMECLLHNRVSNTVEPPTQ